MGMSYSQRAKNDFTGNKTPSITSLRKLILWLAPGILTLLVILTSSCSTIPESRDHPDSVNSTTPGTIPFYTYKIINVYPHDRNAFTQGLVFENGFLYEGTGLRGRSTLRRVELETGNILQLRKIPEQFFGEGITILEDKIIQLTWQSNVGFVYDKQSFELLREFSYPTEGWGITHDGEHLIMSDGTSILYFLDPVTFDETSRIQVSDNNIPVPRLNELEYVNGEIYANIWQTERIARISPHTGNVVGWIDLKGLLSPEDRNGAVDVLNGIAYDSKEDRLFVTGKLWPKVFEIVPVSFPSPLKEGGNEESCHNENNNYLEQGTGNKTQKGAESRPDCLLGFPFGYQLP